MEESPRNGHFRYYQNVEETERWMVLVLKPQVLFTTMLQCSIRAGWGVKYVLTEKGGESRC